MWTKITLTLDELKKNKKKQPVWSCWSRFANWWMRVCRVWGAKHKKEKWLTKKQQKTASIISFHTICWNSFVMLTSHSDIEHRFCYCGNQADSNHWLPASMILSALIEAGAKCWASKPEQPHISAKWRRFAPSGTLPKRTASDAPCGLECLL